MAASWSEYSTGVYGNEKLSDSARHIAALQTRLNEMADKSPEFNVGRKSGDKVGVRLVGRITEDASGALGEFTKIPFGKPPTYEVTAQIYRRGFAVAYTSTLEELDRLNVESSMIRSLTDHAARTHNDVIDSVATAGRSFTYCPLTSSTYAWRTDGTVVGTEAAPFTLFHTRKLTLEAMRVNMPYADGKSYFAFVSPTIYFDLLGDAAVNGWMDVKKYSSGGAEGILNNEVGQVGALRFVVDNHTVADQIGTSSLYGSGYVAGFEALKEVMGPYPLHFRANMNLGGDFGMQQALAWVSFQHWKVVWNYTTHGQASLIHITSA